MTDSNPGGSVLKKFYEACSGDPGTLIKDRYSTSGSGDEELPVTPRSHRRVSGSLNTLKEPWVPAPGRSTRGTSLQKHSPRQGQDSSIHEKSVSNPEMPVTAKSSSSSLIRKAIVSPLGSKSKKERARDRTGKRAVGDRNLSGYTLQTKDSLVDITAHLQAQREEVLQLWQKNLPNSNPEILAELEKANLLALEATTEVNKLRHAIQELENKRKPLTDAESQSLEDIRNRVFLKLKDFKASQSQIQLNTRKNRETSFQRQAEAPAVIPVTPVSSKSKIETFPAHTSSSSIIVLKEKNKDCFSDPDTDSESEQYRSHEYLNKFHDKEATDSGSESVDLSKLTKLYSEEFDLPKRTSKSREGLDKVPEIIDENAQGPSTCKLDTNFDGSCTYYRDKIHELYKKLLDQECNYEDMTREIQRIDSEKGFQIKMLKSNIESQLGELAALPELMELSERKMNEAVVAKFAIESSLQLKIQELKALKVEIERLRKELQETKSHLDKSESKQEAYLAKMDNLNDENKALRTELSARTDTLIRLEQKLGSQIQTQEAQGNADRRNMVLEDKILQLEHALAKEKKKNSILKHVKDKLSKEMTQREEELLASLESVQARNKALQNQIQLVKTSYYELFSPIYGSEIFPETIRVVNEKRSGQVENIGVEKANG